MSLTLIETSNYQIKLMCKIRILLSAAILAFAMLATSCSEGTTPESTGSQTQSLNQWFDIKYEELLQTSPLQLTYQGRKDHYGKIDDLSEAAEDEQLAWYEATVNELKEQYNYNDLSPDEKASYDLWIYQYEQLKEAKKFRQLDYVFDQMRGLHTQLPNILINFHKVDSLEDMQAYISRIKESGRAINQLVERAKAQSDAGVLPPKFTFETVITQTKALIDGKPFAEAEYGSPLWNDMSSEIDTLLSAGKIDEQQAEALRDSTELALVQHFKPAYDNLLAWLQASVVKAEEAPTGVSRHPQGDAFYNYRLKASTTTSLTAEEVHEIGLKEVARIKEEMLAIKNQVGFEGSLAEFFKFINTDPQFFFPNTDEGRQAYLDESTTYLDAINEKLPEYFGILPKADLVVKRVEAFREQDGAPQHYFPGTPDGSRPGTYYVHLSDMKAMPKTTLEGVAYHEGNPGHHMQISIAQELESVPKFRTQQNFTAYAEGWALYSELLAKEMGGYQNPYYDFGSLAGHSAGS